MPTIHHYLDLSTSHLDRETAEGLDDGTVDSPWFSLLCSAHDSEVYAYVMLVPEPGLYEPDEEAEWPQCIRDCIAFARRHECHYIRFDCDGEVAEELPTYW